MGIIPLKKVTIYGLAPEKERVLSDLQTLGCLHIIPFQREGHEGPGEGPSPQARDALKFLLSCRQRRKQIHKKGQFDAESVEQRALEIKEEIRSLEDEVDFLRDRIGDVTPWGNFDFPELSEIKNLRLWFYLVAHKDLKDLKQTDLIWSVVKRDASYHYVVVISAEEPHGVPAPRVHMGKRSLVQLEQRLEEIEITLEDLQAERIALTRWCDLYAQTLNQLEDQEQLSHVAGQTLDADPLFALQAWVPRNKITDIRAYADSNHLATIVEDPSQDETPPTLLQNPPRLSSGQDLLSFYMTPNYWLSDPSTIIFFSFILFFAIILGDAGYGLVLAAGVLMGWRKMGRSDTGRRMRILLGAVVGTTIGWGMLVGSYFGALPPEGSFLANCKLLDLNDYTTMMMISIGIGASHIVIANIMDILRKGFAVLSLVPLGWIVVIGGAISMGLAGDSNQEVSNFSRYVLAAGLALILIFSGAGKKTGKRIFSGLLGLTRITSAFGDILSYLRLFALGLATTSLAIAFNDLASQVAASAPGVGLLFALLILLIGHLLNLLLGIVSGVVHGLRLNLIEFLNWSIPEEGYPFRRFARKEEATWSK